MRLLAASPLLCFLLVTSPAWSQMRDPNAAGQLPSLAKATDTTWLPAWRIVEQYLNGSSPRWDTLQMDHYEYNGAGRLLRDSVNSFTAFGPRPSNLHEYGYDAAGNLVSEAFFTWIFPSGGWENNHREETTFDAHRGRTSHMTLNWNSTFSRWDTTTQIRWTLTYDSADRLVEQVQQNKEFGVWRTLFKNEWAFTTDGLDSLVASYSYDGASWLNVGRFLWEYDAAGILTDEHQFVGSPSGLSWEPLRHCYGYTWHDFPRRLFLTRIKDEWDGTTMVPHERITNTYGSYDSRVELQEFTDSTGAWQPDRQLIENFDSYHLPTLEEYRYWVDTSFSLISGFQHFYTRGSLGQLLVEEIHNHGPTGYYPSLRYSYGAHMVDAEAPQPSEGLVAWPNPAKDALHIRLPQGAWHLTLARMDGQIIQTAELTLQASCIHSWDVSTLAHGTYLVQCRSEGSFACQLVILH